MKGQHLFLVLGLLFAIVVLAGCVSRGDYQDLENVVANQARVIGNLKNYNHDLQLKYDRAVSDNPLVEEENARLKRELAVYKEQYAKIKDLWENRPAQKAPEGMKFEPWGIRAAASLKLRYSHRFSTMVFDLITKNRDGVCGMCFTCPNATRVRECILYWLFSATFPLRIWRDTAPGEVIWNRIPTASERRA